MLFEARSHYYHEGVVGKPALVSNPRDSFFLLPPLWGALPLLIYVEGAGYMWSPIRIRTSLSLIQTGYKSWS